MAGMFKLEQEPVIGDGGVINGTFTPGGAFSSPPPLLFPAAVPEVVRFLLIKFFKLGIMSTDLFHRLLNSSLSFAGCITMLW